VHEHYSFIIIRILISYILNIFNTSYQWPQLFMWWRLFQKRIMHTKFDIYIFITGAGIFATTVTAGTIAIIWPFNAMERPFLRDLISCRQLVKTSVIS
jgi:hypothetical protein